MSGETDENKHRKPNPVIHEEPWPQVLSSHSIQHPSAVVWLAPRVTPASLRPWLLLASLSCSSSISAPRLSHPEAQEPLPSWVMMSPQCRGGEWAIGSPSLRLTSEAVSALLPRLLRKHKTSYRARVLRYSKVVCCSEPHHV